MSDTRRFDTPLELAEHLYGCATDPTDNAPEKVRKASLARQFANKVWLERARADE